MISRLTLYSFGSLSPLRRQVITESSDSLISQASSLPPKICENPEHLPPALPPKRHRTNIKLNSLTETPPSSPKFFASESLEMPAAAAAVAASTNNDLSSQNNNNNSVIVNNRNKIDGMKMPNLEHQQRPPTSPSSGNYVQISTSTIAAAAAEAETAKQRGAESAQHAAIVVVPAAPVSPSAKTPPANNSVADVKCSAVNNDVRVIYTNVNNLFTNSTTTNNRSSAAPAATGNAQHYMQMYDGCANDRGKSNKIIDCDIESNSANHSANNHGNRQKAGCGQSIINNNINKTHNSNSNHSINTADKHANDDEEDIVVLRRPQASSNSSLKVLISTLLSIYCY